MKRRCLTGGPPLPINHVHSELWLIREGTVETTVNDTSHRLGLGSVGFVHSSNEHGIKNVGATPRHILWWLWAPARILDKRKPKAESQRYMEMA